MADSVVEVEGHTAPGFGSVEAAFVRNFDRLDEVGASVAVVVAGEPVVDLWGGHLDRSRTRPWTEDTIINVWSTTKTMANLALLVLASRDLVDLDAPVATYWPEFAANDKGDVLVRHVLSHTAGLPSWDEPLVARDLEDRERLCAMLAAQPTWWRPGTRSGYHTLTQGYLVGEIVRRCDGRSLSRFFAEEMAKPLDADFHIGLDPVHDSRVAFVIPEQLGSSASAAARTAEVDSIMARAANVTLGAEDSWEPSWRRAEIPAASGHGNARSVARLQSVVSAGGRIDERTLLAPDIVERIFDVQASGRDLVLGVGVTFGMGYGLNSPRAPISPNRRVCYWGGWGGSLVVNDLDAGFTMAYVMNRMGAGTLGDSRAFELLAATYLALGAG